jgi:1-acyl-sn-glycerol-3-phosphate acyltransferase
MSATSELRSEQPGVEHIERRFRSPSVRLARPVVLGGIRALALVRRFGWEEVGVERLRTVEPPFVLAANHVSHADTAAILGTLPRRLRGRTAVAAALDVFGPSSTGRTARNDLLQLVVAAGFHAFAFDRHGPPLRSIRTSVQLIRNGWNLLLYPEGTRSRSGLMGPFKAGIGVLARFTGRPVIPVHVEGGSRLLPQGAFMPRSARIIVRYGAPLWYGESESPDEFAQRLREQVARLGRVMIDTSAVRAGAAADQPA